MSEKPPSKDEALEALDFIVNVLKEHEKDLDRLVNELATVADQMGDNGELSSKVEKIEAKINLLQNDIGSLLKRFSASPNGIQHAPAVIPTAKDTQIEPVQVGLISGPPLVLQCKQWDDFKVMAYQAHTVSFTIKETETTFEIEALKNNQVITYNGEIPRFAALLKTWLSKELEVPEKKILEGVLAIS
jgi:chaperonin cofactor prefoldin